MSRTAFPLRVVHLDTVHPWDDVRIYHKECRSLAQAGYEVHLIACPGARPPSSEDLVRVTVLPRTTSRLARILVQVHALRECLHSRPDVVHFHSPELISAMIVTKALYPSCRVVFDVHENVVALPETRKIAPPVLRRLLRPVLCGLLRLAERTFDAIIIAEESYQRLLRIPGVVVRNYPIVSRMPPAAFSPKRQDREELPLRLVYFGSVSERRGVRIMLEAVRLLRDWRLPVHLDVLGPFAAEADRDLAFHFRTKHHLDDRTSFSDGRVPHEEGLRRIAAADVGLCVLQPDPNYVDSLPTKLFEYMMMGVPAIVSDFPLWRAIVEDADCGVVVDPTDGEALARAIVSLMQDPVARVRLGENGRRAVMDRYNWEKESRSLLDLYTGLAAETGSGFKSQT